MSDEDDGWDPEKHFSYGYRMVWIEKNCGAHYLKIGKVIFKKDKALYIENEDENITGLLTYTFDRFRDKRLASSPEELRDQHLELIDFLNRRFQDAYDFPIIDEKTMKELTLEEWIKLKGEAAPHGQKQKCFCFAQY